MPYTDPEKSRARTRRGLARLREKVGGAAALNKIWRAKNQEKYKAHKAVEYAVKVGKLVRLPCEDCGDERSHAHHDDYFKRLEVRWLCATHHKAYHKTLQTL
jgi:hypothetical protein